MLVTRVGDEHLMGFSAPLAEEAASRLDSGPNEQFAGAGIPFESLGDAAKLGANGGLEAAVGDLLNPISQKGNQDFPADAGRGWLFVELLPKIAKLTLRKVRQLRNLMGNVLSIVTRLPRRHSDACARRTVKRN